MLVHIVRGNDDRWVLFQHRAEGLQFGACIGGACRIRRTVEEQQPRLRCDRRLEEARCDLEAGLHHRRDDDWLRIRQLDHVRVRDPVGRWHDSLVTGVQYGAAHVVASLFRTA